MPSHSVSVIGTTDTPVEDPDDIEATPAEVAAMLEAADALLPGFSRSRALRVWSGARPLLPKTVAAAGAADDRAVSRSHTVLRHRERDGIAGFVSIAGGKLTTFRLMAKDTVDAVCAELGTERPCKTAETRFRRRRRQLLPAARPPEGVQAGARRQPDDLRVRSWFRRPTCWRLGGTTPTCRSTTSAGSSGSGWGPARGGSAPSGPPAILHGHGEYDREEANAALRAFVQERWKGQRPVLWGQQLRQARLDAWIFQGVLDLERVPS